jgi:hypothetical protein
MGHGLNSHDADSGTLMALAMLSAWRQRKGVRRCKAVVTGMRVALGMEAMGAVPIRPDGLEPTREALRTFCENCGALRAGAAGAQNIPRTRFDWPKSY